MDIAPTLLFVLLNAAEVGGMDCAVEIVARLLGSTARRDLEWRPKGSLREQWCAPLI